MSDMTEREDNGEIIVYNDYNYKEWWRNNIAFALDWRVLPLSTITKQEEEEEEEEDSPIQIWIWANLFEVEMLSTLRTSSLWVQ